MSLSGKKKKKGNGKKDKLPITQAKVFARRQPTSFLHTCWPEAKDNSSCSPGLSENYHAQSFFCVCEYRALNKVSRLYDVEMA